MKILYYIHHLGVGGAETLAVDYLIKLKEKGCQVVLVEEEIKDSFLERRLQQHGIPTIGLFPKFSYTLPGRIRRTIVRKMVNTSKRWREILEKENPHIFHAHTFTDHLSDLVFPPHRMVYTFHADMKRSLKLGTQRNLQNLKTFAAGGMMFFAINRQMQQEIKTYFNTDKVVYIPNGVNIGEIQKKKYNRKEFMQSLNIPAQAFVIGQVGRFNPVKNHEKTLEIFGEIVGRGVDAYLLLVGAGDSLRTQRLRAIADSRGVTDRVRFLGLREDATQIMSVLDAVVLPSISESFSLVLVEAQAHNVRCVASSAVPAEVICNNNCFKLDINAPAETWADLLLGDTVRDEFCSIRQFDLTAVVERMLEEYHSIILQDELR